MTFKKMTMTSAAIAMIAVPSLAAAAPSANVARPLSISSSVRTGSTTTDKNSMTRQGAIIGGILVLGVVAGGIIAIANDDDKPSSR